MNRACALALMVVFLFINDESAFASQIQAGLITPADLPGWVCGHGKKVPLEIHARVSCDSARFQGCSECDRALVVMNRSASTILVKVALEGPGFTLDQAGAYSMGCLTSPPGHRGASAFCPDRLPPGGACFEHMRFCPEHSGVSRGHLGITIEDSGKSQTANAALVGTAIYNAEQLAAENVRIRHLAELMKLPNVHGVVLAYSDHRLVINIQVNNEHDIKEARKKAPRELEGYKIEVTTYSPVDYAL